MNTQQFKDKTFQLAIKGRKLAKQLGPDETNRVIGRQLIRSATSVGANYRAACRAQSRADFIRKMKIVEEEADETLYWLEILAYFGGPNSQRQDLYEHTDAVLAMTVASLKTARSR